MREIEAEKTIYVGDCSVVMDYKKENATSILCQVMFDETVRLRKCANRKERENIRNFIKEAYSLFLEENSRSECLKKEKASKVGRTPRKPLRMVISGEAILLQTQAFAREYQKRNGRLIDN